MYKQQKEFDSGSLGEAIKVCGPSSGCYLFSYVPWAKNAFCIIKLKNKNKNII